MNRENHRTRYYSGKSNRFDEGKKARVPGKRSLITFTFVRNNASRLRMPDKMCVVTTRTNES